MLSRFLWQRRSVAKEVVSQFPWQLSMERWLVSGLRISLWNMRSSKYNLTPLSWKEHTLLSLFPFAAGRNGNLGTGAVEAILDSKMEAVYWESESKQDRRSEGTWDDGATSLAPHCACLFCYMTQTSAAILFKTLFFGLCYRSKICFLTNTEFLGIISHPIGSFLCDKSASVS